MTSIHDFTVMYEQGAQAVVQYNVSVVLLVGGRLYHRDHDPQRAVQMIRVIFVYKK